MTSFPFFILLRDVYQHTYADDGRLTNTRAFFPDPFTRWAVFVYWRVKRGDGTHRESTSRPTAVVLGRDESRHGTSRMVVHPTEAHNEIVSRHASPSPAGSSVQPPAIKSSRNSPVNEFRVLDAGSDAFDRCARARG
jgi:hypothetical protein